MKTEAMVRMVLAYREKRAPWWPGQDYAIPGASMYAEIRAIVVNAILFGLVY